jgi:glycosyltransferase involved in cell wall biosynthesis
VLYSDRPLPPGVLLDDAAAEVRVLPFSRGWTHLRLSGELLSHPPDVLFVPAHVVPFVHPRRTVVTIHDLGYEFFPETHRAGDRWYLRLSTAWSVREAAAVIVPSRATYRDLLARHAVPAEKVHVIPSGLDPAYLAPVAAERVARVRARYGLVDDYVLTVGTVHPRKNLARLLEAFELVRTRHPWLQLAVTGQPGWRVERLRASAARLGKAIVWAGYVGQDDLHALYAGARVFAFPSLFEGFGFPILEAMASGVPVLTSSTSALPEVAGEAALCVDPLDTGAIAGGLLRLLEDRALADDLVARGRARATSFRWEDTAAATLDLLQRVADRG